MSVSQTAFRTALLDAAEPVPGGLTDPQGRPAGKRFAVYRNNVAVSLTEALETGFPVLRKLLGEENFKGLAGIALRRDPPRSPLLMQYGADLPALLQSLPQLAHLPYLADVARLELALRAAYHAADADGIAPERLAALPPERLLAARLVLAPAVRVLASPYPVLGIWRRNAVPGTPVPEPRPEEVLILRPGFDPEPHLLPAGGATLITALIGGATVGEALDAAPEGVDLATTLALLLQGGAITDIREDT